MRLFISYAHVDKAVVTDWIANKLRLAGHDVWIDERLFVGQDWLSQLEQAIWQSDAFVYAMSPESLRSDVCKWEMSKAVEFGKPIVPVLIQAQTEIPVPLNKVQYVDFSNGPTGDAVANLVGGLQQLNRRQILTAPTTPQRNILTTQRPLSKEKKQRVSTIEMLGLILALISAIAAVIAIWPIVFPSSEKPTANVSYATPSTPIVEARRNLEIRTGPGPNFELINILPPGNMLDIIGATEDNLWYLVLLTDGSTGWLLAAESGAIYHGNPAILRKITPTATITPSLTFTPTPSDTTTFTPTPSLTPTSTDTLQPTSTLTSTLTLTPTVTRTASPTSTATHTMPPTFTSTPTNTPRLTGTFTLELEITTQPATVSTLTSTATGQATLTEPTSIPGYPCSATVVTGKGDPLNIIRAEPDSSALVIESIHAGVTVTIVERVGKNPSDFWYRIAPVDRERWVDPKWLILDPSCPK